MQYRLFKKQLKCVFNSNRDKNQISCFCIPIRQLKNVHKLTLSKGQLIEF